MYEVRAERRTCADYSTRPSPGTTGPRSRLTRDRRDRPPLEPARGLDEVADDRVAVERLYRPALVVPVWHAPHRAPGGPRGEDVVQRSRRSRGRPARGAKKLARMHYGQGIGFPPRDGVPAHDAAEESARDPARSRSSRVKRPALFVTQPRPKPQLVDAREPRDDAGIRTRAPAGLRGVPALEEPAARERRVPAPRCRRPPGERAVDERRPIPWPM